MYIPMGLLNVFSKQQEQETQHYLLLWISESLITVGLGESVGAKNTIVKLSTPKEWTDTETLLDAADVAIGELSEEAKDVKNTLVYVPEEWLEEAKLTHKYQTLLEQLNAELSLTTIGVGNVPASLLSHFTSQYGNQFGCLFVDFKPTELIVSYLRLGEMVQKEHVGRSGDSIGDVVEASARMKFTPLPAKIYLYSQLLSDEDVQQEKQQLSSYPWTDQEQFIQLPQIQMFQQKELFTILLTQGLQGIHPQGQQAKQHMPQENIDNKEVVTPEIEQTKIMPQTPIPSPVQPSVEQQHNVEPEEQQELVTPEAEEFGFSSVEKPEEGKPQGQKVESFGVPIKPQMSEKNVSYAIALDTEEQTEKTQKKKRKKFSVKIPKVSFPSIHFPTLHGKKSVATLISLFGVILITIGLTVGLFLRFTSRVYLDVKLTTVPVSAETQVFLNPEIKTSKPEERILKATVVTKEINGTKDFNSTGSKIIGEKATGVVTIFNKTESKKTFDKGTTIVADGQNFTLTESVTIASSSAQEDDDMNITITPGKENASVVANDIGSEHNMPANTEFQVANYGTSSYAAKNDEAFSGGSSREIQAVSQEDQEKALETLKQELIEKASEELRADLSDGEYLIPTGKVEVVESEFSDEVGKEVYSFTLNLTVTVEAISYTAQDLRPVAQEILETELPDGAALIDERTSILSKESEIASGSGSITLDATISSEYVPPSDSQSWLEQIQGRTFEQVTRILESQQGVEQVQIQVGPRIARMVLGSVPKDTDRIVIEKRVE